jgi:hypothetical protein
MAWTTELKIAPGDEASDWCVLGGPYKTVALAKRCARTHFTGLERVTVTPEYRVLDGNGTVRHYSKGLRGGWRINWMMSQYEIDRRDAARFGPIGLASIRRQAIAQGLKDPTVLASEMKWGLWSSEAAALAVLQQPGLTPEELHEAFREEFSEWSFAPGYSQAERTHPSLCEHTYLSADEKEYDLMFIEVVRACAMTEARAT